MLLKGLVRKLPICWLIGNIFTVEDLLMYFPYRFNDNRIRDLSEVEHDEVVTVEGMVISMPSLSFYGRKKSRLMVRIMVEKYVISAVFFNQAYLKNKIIMNQPITITGKWNRHKQQITVSQYHNGSAPPNGNEFQPVYSVRGDITVKGLRRFITIAFQQFGKEIHDTFPSFFIAAVPFIFTQRIDSCNAFS